MDKTASKRLRRNDLIFIVALLAIIAVIGGCLYLFGKAGDTVTVSVDGKIVATYPLQVDRVEVIQTADGGVNHLIIEGGKARVESANCPDGICAAHAPISREGESIICLPNKVVISIQTANETDEPDIVA